MAKKALSDEYGCELTKDEQEELDRKAEEITEEIFGTPDHEDRVADVEAAVPEKKKPGRPKKAPVDPEEVKKGDEIPQIVRDVITEKVDLLERLIGNYEQDIEETRTELERKIQDLDARKKDAAEKIAELSAFMGGR